MWKLTLIALFSLSLMHPSHARPGAGQDDGEDYEVARSTRSVQP